MLMLADSLDKISVFVIGGLVAVIWIIAATVQSIAASALRERSRREIAAYIAEGSITPEQGERLMNAGKPDDD